MTTSTDIRNLTSHAIVRRLDALYQIETDQMPRLERDAICDEIEALERESTRREDVALIDQTISSLEVMMVRYRDDLKAHSNLVTAYNHLILAHDVINNQ